MLVQPLLHQGMWKLIFVLIPAMDCHWIYRYIKNDLISYPLHYLLFTFDSQLLNKSTIDNSSPFPSFIVTF